MMICIFHETYRFLTRMMHKLNYKMKMTKKFKKYKKDIINGYVNVGKIS